MLQLPVLQEEVVLLAEVAGPLQGLQAVVVVLQLVPPVQVAPEECNTVAGIDILGNQGMSTVHYMTSLYYNTIEYIGILQGCTVQILRNPLIDCSPEASPTAGF